MLPLINDDIFCTIGCRVKIWMLSPKNEHLGKRRINQITKKDRFNEFHSGLLRNLYI